MERRDGYSNVEGNLVVGLVRCQTPDNVEREVWGTLLGYNLVRRLAATAAYVVEKLSDRTGALGGKPCHMKPRAIGFQGTGNVVAASTTGCAS